MGNAGKRPSRRVGPRCGWAEEPTGEGQGRCRAPGSCRDSFSCPCRQHTARHHAVPQSTAQCRTRSLPRGAGEAGKEPAEGQVTDDGHLCSQEGGGGGEAGVCWRQSWVALLRAAPVVKVPDPWERPLGTRNLLSGGSGRPRPGPGSLFSLWSLFQLCSHASDGELIPHPMAHQKLRLLPK